MWPFSKPEKKQSLPEDFDFDNIVLHITQRSAKAQVTFIHKLFTGIQNPSVLKSAKRYVTKRIADVTITELG